VAPELDPARAYPAVVALLPRPPLEAVIPDAFVVRSPWVQPVEAERRPERPRVAVDRDDASGWRVREPDGTVLAAGLTEPGAAAALEHLGRWHALAALANPGSVLASQVALTWAHPDDVSIRDDGSAPALDGMSRPEVRLDLRALPGGGWATDAFYLRVVNQSGRRLYAALVDLTPAFAASVALLPPAPLEPGVTVANEGRAIRFGVAGPSRPFVDRLRLVVSDQPILAEPFELTSLAGEAAGTAPAPETAAATPARFAATTREGTPPDWAVVAVDVHAEPA
jgi:hypothetical protein